MGHYTAVCLSTVTGTWHHFDDATVREVQDGSVQSSSAYMLLYSRKPIQKPNIQGLSLWITRWDNFILNCRYTDRFLTICTRGFSKPPL